MKVGFQQSPTIGCRRFFSRLFNAVFVPRSAISKRIRPVAWKIESLECRRLLSSSGIPLVLPAYQSSAAGPAISPAATAAQQGFSPDQIHKAYQFDQIEFSSRVTADGAGTTIAIVDAYDDPNIWSDLQHFDRQFALPDPVFTKVNQTGGTTMPSANSEWITEIALDVEWAHAIAPGAQILLVQANSAAYSDLTTAVDYARNVPGVVAVSMSWGSNEFATETRFDDMFQTPSGHTGISFIAASGDRGAPASYPASSPNVASIGGTSLAVTSEGYAGETAWTGSGGGISAVETQPEYQHAVVTGSVTMRTNPDVAYDADPHTGVPVYDSYNNGNSTPWRQWGGTSIGAPQWAGLIAIADLGRAIAGLDSLDGRTGLLKRLYQLPTNDFHDTALGISTGTPNYSATAGYDLVTGRGTPIANLIVTDLIGESVASTPVLSGNSTLAYLRSQSPTAINPTIALSDPGVATLSSATVHLLNSDADEDVLSFVNGSQTVYGNISAQFNPNLGTLTLSSTGSTATVTQFQRALRAVTYFNSRAGSARLGDRSVAFQVSDGQAISNVVTSVITVCQASTKAIVSFNVTSAVSGQQVTLTARISAVGLSSGNRTPGPAKGSIQFLDGNVPLAGTIKYGVVRGVLTASLNASALAPGVHQISAAYSGDDVFRKSVAAAARITVFHAGTTCTVTSSDTAVPFGKPATLTATVSVLRPGAGIPTVGNGLAMVDFRNGNSVIPGTVNYRVVNGKLTATLTTSSLPTGIHKIVATYTGDSKFLLKTSRPVTQTVVDPATTLVVSSSVHRLSFGQPVILTATVEQPSIRTDGDLGSVTVVFVDGTQAISGNVAYTFVKGNLFATLMTSELDSGVHQISAVYRAGPHDAPRRSMPVNLTVLPLHTATVLASSNSSSTVGQPVTLLATVCSMNEGTFLADHRARIAAVTFLDGGQAVSGTVNSKIVDGKLVAMLTTNKLSPGYHLITASYTGTMNSATSRSGPVRVTIFHAATVCVLSSAEAIVGSRQSLTLTAKVSSVGTSYRFSKLMAEPETVEFLDGGQPIVGTVAYRIVNGQLIVTLTISRLSPGVHKIKAIYLSDSSFLSSKSTAVSPVVRSAVASLVT